ncbi:hypothetical protein AB6F55_03645 [Providencia hangzhouensis]
MKNSSTVTNKPDDLSAGVYVLQQTIGFMFQAALRAAAKLNLAEHLREWPQNVRAASTRTRLQRKNNSPNTAPACQPPFLPL